MTPVRVFFIKKLHDFKKEKKFVKKTEKSALIHCLSEHYKRKLQMEK